MAHTRCLAVTTAWVLANTVSFSLQAAEWRADPSVELREEYNDNIRLTNAAHDDVWGTILDPRLSLSRRSELWDLTANGRVRAAWYSGDQDLDTTDTFLDLAVKRSFERGSWQASAGLINDTTLRNEVLDQDTGLVVNQVDREQRQGSLGGEYMLTETFWIEASLGYSEYEYDQGQRFGLSDYDYLTPSLRGIYQLNHKTQLFTTLTHSRVEYDSVSELVSKTNSLQVGASYEITELWTLSGSVGGRRTESEFTEFQQPIPGGPVFPFQREESNNGLVYDVSFTREFETGQLGFTASRSVIPSSTGADTETTRVNLNGAYRFNPRLRTRLVLSYYDSATLGERQTLADTERYRVAPSVEWRWTEALTLNAGYSYTRVKRDVAVSSGNVDSNAAFISLGYSWPPLSVSR